MRVVVQRVARASVTIAGDVVGEIGRGLLVLVGVATADTAADVRWMADKLVGLRVFDDADGRMNLSLGDVGGSLLVVSQFTLLGDCRRGRRPSFTSAADPGMARELYELLCGLIRERGVVVETGRFREQMMVELANDGPVTLWIDSTER